MFKSDVDRVIKASRRLEALLERHGASGRGLHEKVSSLEANLAPSLVKRLRFIATVRNKVVHEDGARIDDSSGFESACRAAERELRRSGSRLSWIKWFVLLDVVLFGVFLIWWFWLR